MDKRIGGREGGASARGKALLFPCLSVGHQRDVACSWRSGDAVSLLTMQWL